MGIHYFPCQFVYWRKIKNHENFKQRLLKCINDRSSAFGKHDLIEGSGATSHVHPSKLKSDDLHYTLMKENPDIIQEIVWNSLDELILELNSRENHKKVDIIDSNIDNSWISVYDQNSTVSCHCHYNHPISGGEIPSFVVVYILNDANDYNTTEFLLLNGQAPPLSNVSDYRFKTADVNEIREGVVMIFPSNLYHQVNSVKKKGRVVYTFNIFSRFFN